MIKGFKRKGPRELFERGTTTQIQKAVHAAACGGSML
jgi:hypothetical protein